MAPVYGNMAWRGVGGTRTSHHTAWQNVVRVPVWPWLGAGSEEVVEQGWQTVTLRGISRRHRWRVALVVTSGSAAATASPSPTYRMSIATCLESSRAEKRRRGSLPPLSSSALGRNRGFMMPILLANSACDQAAEKPRSSRLDLIAFQGANPVSHAFRRKPPQQPAIPRTHACEPDSMHRSVGRCTHDEASKEKRHSD